jgi:uncharacterized repeat protein (TIGR01451 family)
MLVRWFVGLLMAAALAAGISASSARAVYILGATYSGPHSSGGTVAFTVSADGRTITGFTYTGLPIGCGTSLSDGPRYEVVPITGATFSYSGDNDIAYTGTFTGPQTATGTLVWNGPYCPDQHATVTWQATTSAPFRADLAVDLAESPDSVVVGGELMYTATIHNAELDGGASAATGVVLTETVPAGTELIAASSSQGTCAESNGVVTCELGAIPNGGEATATLNLKADRAGQVVASATVTSAAEDPVPTDNMATEETTVQPLCSVPNVVGKPLAAAKTAIARGHCRMGKITRAYSKRVRKGRVVSQRPPAGTRLLPNAGVVKLVVSRGPKPKR